MGAVWQWHEKAERSASNIGSLAGGRWLSAALGCSGQGEVIAEHRFTQHMAAQHVEGGKGEDLAATLRVGVADLDRLTDVFSIGAE